MSLPKLVPCLLALFVFVGGADGVRADEGDRTFAVLDVSDLTTPIDQPIGPGLGLPSSIRMYPPGVPEWRMSSDREQIAKRRRPWINAERLVELIYTQIDPPSWEMEGSAIEVRANGRIYVWNRAAVVDSVRDFVEELRKEASRRVELSLRVDDDSGTKASASLSLSPARAGVVSQTRSTRFVADYEVEIAQGAAIGNPTIQDALGGFVAELVATPTVDGSRVVLEGVLQQGELTGMRSVDLGYDEEYLPRPPRRQQAFTHGRVELPTYDGIAVVMSTVVGVGEEVVVPIQAGRSRTLRMTPTLSGGPVALPNLVPAGSLFRPMTGANVYVPVVEGVFRQVRNDYIPPPSLGFDDEGASEMSADLFLDLLQQTVSPRKWGDPWMVEALPPSHLLLVADEAGRAAVRRFVAEREAELLRPVKLGVRVIATSAPFEVGAGRPAPEGELLAAATIPTLFGRRACLIAGTNAAYLDDYDVEVAQEARIADPFVGHAFDGLVFRAVPRGDAGARTAVVELDLRFYRRTIQSEPHQLDTQYLGPVDKLDLRQCALQTALSMPARGTYVADAGLLGNRRVAIEVTLSP